jgi:hypothetical protein
MPNRYSLTTPQPASVMPSIGVDTWKPSYGLADSMGSYGSVQTQPGAQLGSMVQGSSVPGVSGGGGWFDGFLSTDKQQGWGTPAIGAASGLFNAWMGMKQYGLAKDQLSESKKQFGLNYDAQRTMTNAQLEDRQRARLGAAGGVTGGYKSVGDYMNDHGIKGRG